ncbi:MAG: 16S rRNA (cytosine(1402)-N(4))-methyltransferase RsmH [Salinispira sp.]
MQPERLNGEHFSVMRNEVLHYLAPERSNGVFIDCTLGEGGHSEAFLKTCENIRIAGVDADRQILQRARIRLKEFAPRVQFFNMYFDEFFADYPLKERSHRILFDLGISLFHYTKSGRGFSFFADEPLDMRMDAERGKPLSELLKSLSERQLARVISEFGEERYAKRIAAAIIRARSEKKADQVQAPPRWSPGAAQGRAGKREPLESSSQLGDIIRAAVPADYRRGRIHPATRTFQALRIYVNAELERLQLALRGAFAQLEVGGRMAVISFHSLEDRIVKHTFKELSKACMCPPELPMCECGGNPLAYAPLSGILTASADEVRQNPPSRSAKFRLIEKLRDSRRGI